MNKAMRLVAKSNISKDVDGWEEVKTDFKKKAQEKKKKAREEAKNGKEMSTTN